MPTFLIFRSGSVIQTLRGADARALTSAIESAVKLSTVKPQRLYSTPGRTLSGSGSQARSNIVFSPQSLFDTIIGFLGLYFMSLFSIDPYRSAEASAFNIHRIPNVPLSTAAKNAAVKPPSAQGKKIGTLADVAG